MTASNANAAVGFSIHTGWAVAVALAGPPPRVLARRELVMAEDEHDARFVYHVAAEQPEQAQRLVHDAETTARNRATEWLRQLAEELPVYALVVALPGPRRALPTLSAILSSHPLIHSAEGELFRKAIAAAAMALGFRVAIVQPGEVPVLGKVGPPWGKDQKAAASRAWAALAEAEGAAFKRGR